MQRSWFFLVGAAVILLAPLLLGVFQLLLPPTQVNAAAFVTAHSGANDSYGIAHISYGDGKFVSPTRYRLAQQAGVGWNRWAFYWNEIERSNGVFDYSHQDATVAADQASGLRILGILFGTPDWASPAITQLAGAPSPLVGQRSYSEPLRSLAESAGGPGTTTYPPTGLDQPVFTDGTDLPGPGKAINPRNPWARYAYLTALRYKGRVQAWEVWNEPDFTPTAATGWFGFWSGSVDAYARLLKVGYLAIRAADPDATVVMGGMAFWFQQDYFPRLLAALRRDPEGAAAGYFFDATAWHWYSRPSQLYERTLWVKSELSKAGMPHKRVWVTETNLPVCGDPFLITRFACTSGTHRGTIDHQAAYVIQALAYAQVAGVERVFLFQLFDDGLPPGEYYGLVRNDGSARPALTALHIATSYFRDVVMAYRTVSNGGKVELITLVMSSGQRLRVLWNQDGAGLTVQLPIEGGLPLQVEMTGDSRVLATQAGVLYPFTLTPATLNDNPTPRTAPDYIVGGKPYLLIEQGVQSHPGSVEGMVKDMAARPLAGVSLKVGDLETVSDHQGRYRITTLPGLYDVGVSAQNPFPSITAAILSMPVWSGKSIVKDFAVRPPQQRFFPLLPRRGSTSAP